MPFHKLLIVSYEFRLYLHLAAQGKGLALGDKDFSPLSRWTFRGATAAWLLIVFGIIRSEFPAIHQFVFYTSRCRGPMDFIDGYQSKVPSHEFRVHYVPYSSLGYMRESTQLMVSHKFRLYLHFLLRKALHFTRLLATISRWTFKRQAIYFIKTK